MAQPPSAEPARVSAAELRAVRRALALAATPGVPLGPNPRVGCVLLSPDASVLGAGHHQGAGTPHAEVAALASARGAGADVRGATAVVTLEPCNHTGRTGPCVDALLEAGVARVVVAMRDPNPEAAGGLERLRDEGVDVVLLDAAADQPEVAELVTAAALLNRAWLFGLEHGRPLVTWKFATTLDGRSAASDGTSRWVSGPASRRDTHRLRAQCDAMVVGTGTVAVDDPRLTVRDEDDRPLEHQPLRAVVGRRELESGRRVLDDAAETVQLPTHDPAEVLADLFGRGRRHVFLEGGPTLAAAFLRAGLVDEVVVYVAPMLLGSGVSAVGDLGVTTMADAHHLEVVDVSVIDQRPDPVQDPVLDPARSSAPAAEADRGSIDVRLVLTPRRRSTADRSGPPQQDREQHPQEDQQHPQEED